MIITALTWIVCGIATISWILWAIDRHYDFLMYTPDKKIRPLVWSILAVVLLISGCASAPQSNDSLRADDRAVVMYERIAKTCNAKGGKMIVKKTGTRIRRSYSREDLLRAQCVN